ncbi:MAG TPA: hypothetical protein VF228_02180 [Iamia sp.]
MTDVDQILRDHAAAAEAEPSPDGWERLVAGLEDEPPLVVSIDGRARNPHPRRWVLAAAAVVAVLVVAGAVTLTRSQVDEDMIRPADTAPPTTAAPTATTEASAGRPVIDDASRPDRIAAVLDQNGDGVKDVVRLEGIGVYEDFVDEQGHEATRVRAPEVTMLVDGTSVPFYPIESVEVLPDGTVLYTAGNAVHGVDIDDGAPLGRIAVGRNPAASANGRLIATILPRGDVWVYDAPADTGSRLDPPAEGEGEVTVVSLSPDGTRVARQRVLRDADGTVVDTAVDVTDVGDPDGWEEVEHSPGIGLPVWIGDDVLGVGIGTREASEGQTEVFTAQVGMAHLSTGEVRWSVGMGFRHLEATPAGDWVIADFGGGLRAFAVVDGWLWDEGTVVQIDGIVDAAW